MEACPFDISWSFKYMEESSVCGGVEDYGTIVGSYGYLICLGCSRDVIGNVGCVECYAGDGIGVGVCQWDCLGLCLILVGIYLHLYSDYMESLGVTGIIISAMCIAFGLVFSLPTKMYLTFILVKRESEIASKDKDQIQE